MPTLQILPWDFKYWPNYGMCIVGPPISGSHHEKSTPVPDGDLHILWIARSQGDMAVVWISSPWNTPAVASIIEPMVVRIGTDPNSHHSIACVWSGETFKPLPTQRCLCKLIRVWSNIMHPTKVQSDGWLYSIYKSSLVDANIHNISKSEYHSSGGYP